MPPNPELNILNAESYNDGKLGFRAPRSLPSGRPRRAATGDEPPRSKKRTKAQSSEAGELEDEDKKRSRGRPRLDTNDETAKDRRRTQIRLAQRAYRNRKETAIQSLEKKVDELRKTNEEMSKEFMRLYDFAVSKGMHESTPEFGRQLQATTEKFVALARRSSEELENDGDLPTSQDNDVDAQEASPTIGNAGLSDTSGSQDVAVKPAEMMYGGFIVSHGEDTAHSTPRSQTLTAMHTTSWATDSQPQAPQSTAPQAPLGYEIVTEPTTDNASFPFGMSFDDSLDQAGSPNLSGQPISETLFSIISPPSSYAYQERTFGRRLQRSTLEKAYFLVCMPDPPPALMSRAFGFCLLFEPKERIKERLANCLRVKERESMFNWKFPFWNLGGGGTWFDEMDETDYSRAGKLRGPVGNQGTAEPHRHKVDSMFGLGPWDARTEETRDLRVDHEAAKLHMSVPGFEGDFYDADEVEWVLQRRGILIPPAADFVTAEIDPADFSTDTAAGGQVFGTGSQSSVDDIIGGLRHAEKSPLAHFARGYVGMNLKPTRASDIHNGAHSVARTEEALPALEDIDPSIDPSLGGDAFGLGEKPVNGVSNTGSRQRLVTINVGVLVQEIALRSVCLGRTPGVRPKDVNVAFWASLAV
ncbi:BZIP family transcription factor [Colletotrichum navitas]|uniref:BZIP family transcription factor n=1 Tax=Colletotrichum navitas TaxID=681940 RepID=A0AAD8PQW8_9PEZI|nr:BZIP family transcription factor [Colletotrichum navitas]KAK1574735.1 BZIP family transcription factor [Colletotrichum navitas]